MRITILVALLCLVYCSQAAFAQAGPMRNGLAPTSMDSFVYEAGGQADLIYGDEGTTDIPPYFEFTSASRINTGIVGTDAAGLTTGHGSYMPCAWGADEFLAPPGEWSMSGNNGGNLDYNNAGAPGANLSTQENQANTAQNAYTQALNTQQQLQQTVNNDQAALQTPNLSLLQTVQDEYALSQAQLALQGQSAVVSQTQAAATQASQALNTAAQQAEGATSQF